MQTPQDPEESVEELLFEYLERHETEGPSAFEDIVRRSPSMRDRLQKRIDALQKAGLLGAGDTQEDFPERMGEFDLKERLGGGGMGIVFRAEQTSLGREVAVKLVRPEQLYFGEVRQRFQREVEAVARLNHPGIVPIYSVGEQEGVPYFAMQLVSGCTLGDVIRSLAGSDPKTLDGKDLDMAIVARCPESVDVEPSPLFAGPWHEVCLRLVREVAEALEHAHRRGVLHRDVKPSNVMITRDGKVMLLDFGLATADGDVRMTRTGSAIGSLAYMSPEQVEGRVAHVDRRSDVYALGVTLYELLTLRLPYGGNNAAELRANILDARPATLRNLVPGLPREIETVCATAMESDQARRYASAAELAADISNVLENRPIDAQRAGALLRMKRWAQRNPGWAVGLAMGALMVTVTPTVIALQQIEARRVVSAEKVKVDQANDKLNETLNELEEANDNLEKTNDKLGLTLDELEDANASLEEAIRQSDEQRGLAERNLSRAMSAIDTMLVEVGRDALRHVPQVEPVQRALFDEAVALYEALLADIGDNDTLLFETTRAWSQVVDIRARGGLIPEALEAADHCIALLEQLLSERPNDTSVQFQLSEAFQDRARVHSVGANPAAAGADFDRALQLLDEVIAVNPKVPYRRARVAGIRRSAERLFDMGRWTEARSLIEGVLDDAEALIAEDPTDYASLSAIGDCYHVLGGIAGEEAMRMARPQAEERFHLAIEWHTKARDARESALLSAPEDRSLEHKFARSALNVGVTSVQVGDVETARQMYDLSLETQERLVRDFPLTPLYQLDYGTSLINYATVVLPEGGLRAATAKLEEAAEVFERLTESHPDNPLYVQRLAGAHTNLGSFLLRVGEADRGLEMLDRAVEELERSESLRPGAPTTLSTLQTAHILRARAFARLGETDEATRILERFLDEPPVNAFLREVLRSWSVCVEVTDQDERLLAPEREVRIANYVEAAIVFAATAVEDGRWRPEDLAATTEIDALRAQPAFLDFLASM